MNEKYSQQEQVPKILHMQLEQTTGEMHIKYCTHRWARPFSPLIRLVCVQINNFRLHDEQTVNGLRKIAWVSVLRFETVTMERQLPFVCCKRKMETANFFVYLGRSAND